MYIYSYLRTKHYSDIGDINQLSYRLGAPDCMFTIPGYDSHGSGTNDYQGLPTKESMTAETLEMLC